MGCKERVAGQDPLQTLGATHLESLDALEPLARAIDWTGADQHLGTHWLGLAQSRPVPSRSASDAVEGLHVVHVAAHSATGGQTKNLGEPVGCKNTFSQCLYLGKFLRVFTGFQLWDGCANSQQMCHGHIL